MSKSIVERLTENRQIETAKSILESNGYDVTEKLNEAEDHAGWEYYEYDGRGPWTANQYMKDYKDELYLSIYPPQKVPGEDYSDEWHASIEGINHGTSIDSYETGFKSFEEAEAWINSQIEKYDPEYDRASHNQRVIQSAIEMISKAVSTVPSELRDELAAQAIEILKSHK